MDASSGKTISGKPSQRTKKGKHQIEQAKDPEGLKKKQAFMEKFVVRPGSKSPSPEPIPKIPEKPVVKKRREGARVENHGRNVEKILFIT